MRFLNTIFNVVFPPKCLVCGQKGEDLCMSCLEDSRGAERESLNWIFPIYDYRHPPIKKALWFLKYKGKKRLAKIFAEVLYGKILEELSELSLLENFREPILIPIPLSNKRLRERGYNQAELICKELINLDTKNDSENNSRNFRLEKNILIKTKETEHQARIKDRGVRLKNLKNSFAVENEEKVSGRNIILIDDVTTTGATLNEAKKVLKKSGARKIIAFTVAH